MEKEKDKAPEGGFDLKKYLKVCLESWRLFAVAAVACVVLAVFYSLVKSTTYEVDAQLKLPTDNPVSGLKIDMAQSFSLGDMFGSSSTDNEIAVLQSHNVFLNTAKDLSLNVWYAERKYGIKWSSLFTKTPINVTTLPAVPDTLRTSIKFILDRRDDDKVDIEVIVRKKTIMELRNQQLPTIVDTPYGPFTISPTEYWPTSEATKLRAVYSGYGYAAEVYTELVDIFAPNKKTDFIGLAYKTPDPAFGERLLGSIIANYILLNNRQKDDKNLETLDFVNERLESLQNEIAVTESAMEAFKRDNKITMPEHDAAFVLEKLGKLDLAVLEAETQAKIVKETLDFVSNPANRYSVIPDLPPGATMSTTADNPTSASAVSSKATNELNAYNQLVLERMKLTSNSAKGSNASVRILEEQIDALHGSIVASVQRAYEASMVKYNEAKRQYDMVQSRIGAIPTIEKQYLGIERNLVVQEQLYLFLLKQREEASMNIAKASHTIEIIDDPYTLTEPLGLSTKMMIVLACLLGILAAAAYVFVFRYKKAPVASLGEMRLTLKAPILATLGKDAESGLITSSSEGPGAESVRRLRSEVQHVLAGCDGKVVAVLSLHDGEGKTYTAVNLALALAMAGRRTLLVDASLHDPSVAEVMGLQTNQGLAQALASMSAPDVVAVKAGNYVLDVITAGQPSELASELLSSDAMASLIADIKGQYDYVVIDTPSLSGHSDALAMSDIPDLTLVVTRVGKTSPAAIDQINDLYQTGRLRRIAVVANQG